MDSKKLANIIKKIAQPAPNAPAEPNMSVDPGVPTAPPTAPTDAGQTGDAPSWDNENTWAAKQAPSGGGNRAQSDAVSNRSAVQEMQEAIINFANMAGSTDITSMKNNKSTQEGRQELETPNPNFDDSQPESPTNPKTIKNKEYLGGSDPFGKFLVSNYLGSSTPIGHQYVNVDVGLQQGREQASMQDTSLRGIIDTIKRIGTPGSEKKPDGIWKSKTNNALKNIFALTFAIFKAAGDMNLTLPGLDQETLDEFKSELPNTYSDVPQNEIADRAKKLTDMIKNMTEVFVAFKNHVLTKPAYAKYINQTASFAKYDKRKEQKNATDTLSKEEQAVKSSYTKPIHVPFSGVKDGRLNQIYLADLENVNTLSSIMQKIGRNPQDQKQVNLTLNEISNAIDNMQTQPAA